MLTFSFLGVTSLDANDDITEQKTEVSLGSFRTMCSLTGSYYTNGTTKKSRTHMQQTWARKVLTRLSWLLQISLWNELFSQSSMLHTWTLLECQEMFRQRSEGPSTKLSLLSWRGELKHSRVHSLGSRKTWHSRRQVRERHLRLSLSRKEKRWRRHSWLSCVRCMVSRQWGEGPPVCYWWRARWSNRNKEPEECIVWPRYMIPPQAHAGGHAHIRPEYVSYFEETTAGILLDAFEPYAPFPSVVTCNRELEPDRPDVFMATA